MDEMKLNITEGEILTHETEVELSNGKGDDEDGTE